MNRVIAVHLQVVKSSMDQFRHPLNAAISARKISLELLTEAYFYRRSSLDTDTF